MEDGHWQTREIQDATIEHNQHRVRRALHRVMPGLVAAPVVSRGMRLNPGDKLVTADGRKRRVGAVIRSAEGVRFYGSSLPTPGFDQTNRAPMSIEADLSDELED